MKPKATHDHGNATGTPCCPECLACASFLGQYKPANGIKTCRVHAGEKGDSDNG